MIVPPVDTVLWEPSIPSRALVELFNPRLGQSTKMNASLAHQDIFVLKDLRSPTRVQLDFIQFFRTQIPSKIACNVLQGIFVLSLQQTQLHVRLELILQGAASLGKAAVQNADQEHIATLDQQKKHSVHQEHILRLQVHSQNRFVDHALWDRFVPTLE